MRNVLKTGDFEDLIVISKIHDPSSTDKNIIEHKYLIDHRGIKVEGKSVLVNNIMIDHKESAICNESRILIDHQGPHMEMHFELSGHTTYSSRVKGGMDVVIPDGQGLFFFFPELKGNLDFAKSEKRSSVEIEFSLDFLRKIFDNDLGILGDFGNNIEKGLPAVFGGRSQVITPVMKQVLYDIVNCNYQGTLKKVYLEAKVMELISLQVGQYNPEAVAETKGSIRKEDIEKLHYAKELILQNIHEPCSLLELAQMSGMNDFKLKKRFKELFGNTVFGYLADVRMEQAKLLILQGKSSIAEISEMVGYKNPQHFTVAFKRKFGFLPKTLKGK